MGLHFLRQAINIGSGTGTQDFTVSGIGTPVAAIFHLATSVSNGTDANHIMQMEGYTDGTNSRCGVATSGRGVGTTNTWSKIVNDAPVITIDPNTGSINGIGEFDSFITDGVRLDFTDLPPAAYFLHVIFIVEEGTGYDVAVGNFNSSSDTSKNIGFEPDIVRAFGVHEAYSSGFTGVASTSGDVEGNLSSGFAARGQGQGCIGWFHLDGVTAGGSGNNAFSTISNTYMGYDGVESGTQITITSTGFDIDPGPVTGQFVGFIAIKFNGNNQFKFGDYATPTSTGSSAITGVGFQPAFVMELLSIHTAFTETNSKGFSFGLTWLHGETNNDHNMSWRGSHLDNPTGGRMRATQNNAHYLKESSDDGSVGSLINGTFTSFDSDGYTKNFTTVSASARKALYLAIGPAASGVGSLISGRLVNNGLLLGGGRLLR